MLNTNTSYFKNIHTKQLKFLRTFEETFRILFCIRFVVIVILGDRYLCTIRVPTLSRIELTNFGLRPDTDL